MVDQEKLTSIEDGQNFMDLWIASKNEVFFRRGIRQLLEEWEEVVASDGQ